jgi:predicted AlkP superfamily phosphohydrolase/phosphomutase
MDLILLGIDGAEPSLIEPWAKAGHLPNFARLIKKGAFGKLESTTHPLTPQAWASIVTGVNPGRHGVFDFGVREPGSYNQRLVTSRDRAWPAFWEILGDSKKVGVVNVPLSFPPDPVNGFFIGGMHTPNLKDGVHPPGLEKQLKGYIIDVMCHWYKKTENFLAEAMEMAEVRHRLVMKLAKKRKPDVLFPVYVAADRVQHALWGLMTPAHRKNPGKLGDQGDAIFHAYKKMDKFLGEYMEMADKENAFLVVVSDHGFGDLKKDVYLNSVFTQTGLLAFDPEKVKKLGAKKLPKAKDKDHAWQRAIFSKAAEELPDDEKIGKGLFDPLYKSFDAVDWSKTKAYSAGLFGHVWLNLQGREPEGVVPPEEYEVTRHMVAAILAALRDPDDGELVVDKVYTREELYSGPQLDRAPDLVVKMRDYAYITRGATEFLCNTVVSNVAVNHTGNHRLHGIVGLYGPGIKHGTTIDEASVVDVTPTLLHLMGEKVPKGLDGNVLESAFTKTFAKKNKIQFTDPAETRKLPPEGLTAEEEEIVRGRLKALGYLG